MQTTVEVHMAAVWYDVCGLNARTALPLAHLLEQRCIVQPSRITLPPELMQRAPPSEAPRGHVALQSAMTTLTKSATEFSMFTPPPNARGVLLLAVQLRMTQSSREAIESSATCRPPPMWERMVILEVGSSWLQLALWRTASGAAGSIWQLAPPYLWQCRC